MPTYHYFRQDPGFPYSLKRIAQPPKQIWVRGDASLLNQRALAVVGSRAISPYGKETTLRLVTESVWAGIVVVSGLALGVDSIAHKAALEAGGKTIAVLPGGIERIYPSNHKDLAEEILNKGGALVSENPGYMRPQKFHFVGRNRIIAGLADAVLITEATKRSGSLHTAQFALDEGKEVMAVPGSIFSPNSVGTHKLISSGAQLISDAQEIVQFFQENPQASRPRGETDQQQVILDLLVNGVTSGYELQKQSQQSLHDFQQAMSLMEIQGKIRRGWGGQWSLA